MWRAGELLDQSACPLSQPLTHRLGRDSELQPYLNPSEDWLQPRPDFYLGQGPCRGRLNPASLISSPPPHSREIRVSCFNSCQTHLGSGHPEEQLLNVAFSRALVWNGSNHKHEVISAATEGHYWRVGVSDVHLLWEEASQFWGNFPPASGDEPAPPVYSKHKLS